MESALKWRNVSIHAPTKGATLYSKRVLYIVLVSIHAPTKGATADELGWLYIFNVSIHAPTKGATSYRRLCA